MRNPQRPSRRFWRWRSASHGSRRRRHTYNSRPLVPEVLVSGTRYAVVRPRQTYDELIALDRLPEWLAE
jgi:hypothetical protein